MILTRDEAQSIVGAQNRVPHQLLGMHPLGDGSGVVVRAFIPDAETVEAIPTHEKKKPAISLKRVDDAGLFEGVTRDAQSVYAYDLKVNYRHGGSRQFRDPFSFLPTLGEMDVYLFG